MPSPSKMVAWGIEQCNNPNCGYDMDGRDSYAYYDGSGRYYFDCSSFVCYGMIEGGWDIENQTRFGWGHSFATSEMMGVFDNFSDWENVGSPNYVYPGDIGLTLSGELDHINSPYGHTEICYEGGTINSAKWMGAHGNGGDLASNFEAQVSCGETKTWGRIFHYTGIDSDTGTSQDIPVYDISMEVVAGIAGNWWWESGGINAARWQTTATKKTWTATGEGYGMGQWTNVNGDNYGALYQLSRYLETNGYSYTSSIGQIEFFLYQASWHTYNWWQKFDGYDSLDDYLHSSETDINTLAKIFCYCWEGVSEYNLGDDVHLEERQEYANRAYNYIKENVDNYDINSWVARDERLSDEEALNNAVLLYRVLINHANNRESSINDNTATVQGKIYQKDSQKGDKGYNWDYTDAVYGYVPPVSLSYDELLALAFGNLTNKEKEAIISIHRKPKGVI